MKNLQVTLGIILAASFIAGGAFAEQLTPKNIGEVKFKEQCAVCHPNGET